MEAHPLYPPFAAALPVASQLHALPFQVYLDLLLAKEWAAVDPAFANEIDKTVLFARRDNEGPAEVVVPMTEREPWSVNSLGHVFASLDPLSPGLQSIVLGILATDSTVVYYRVHKGLVPPAEDKEDP